jgi:hypothetical protein
MGDFLARMRKFSTVLFALLVFTEVSGVSLVAQNNSTSHPTVTNSAAPNPTSIRISGSTIALHTVSTMSVASEMGGAFMVPSKCDAEGNLYIRKLAGDRPLLGPVVKIDADGKRKALFDPASFSQLALDRADAFSPAADGGMYEIAQSGILQPHIFVLHFSSDGSASTPARLDADFEVYTFAAFADGNFLVSGVKRDVKNKDDRGHNFTAVFSADGRELRQLTFPEPSQKPQEPAKAGLRSAANASQRLAPTQSGQASSLQEQTKRDAEKLAPTLDLADAEVGSDGNLYVMRRSSPAIVYVIAPSGEIAKTIRVSGAVLGSAPSAFHVSGNRLAIAFGKEDSESQAQTIVVADAQTGRKITSYSDATGLDGSFACYSANEGVFTFLKLGEGNELEVIRAEAQ